MNHKKPTPAFEVVFSGIYPEQIPFYGLYRTISAIQRLAVGNEPEQTEEQDDSDEVEEDGSVRLLGVRRGSARFECVATSPETARKNLKRIGGFLKNPTGGEVGEFDFALRPLEKVSAIAASLACHVILRDPSANGNGVLATILPESYAHVSRQLLLSGETTITGVVKGVGGSTRMRCRLRVSFQKTLLYCNVANEEVSQKLGHCLYQEVAATGEAQWIQNSWRVFSFKIASIYQPKPGSIIEAFTALRNAGGKCWDDIEDPESYLREVGVRS